MSGGLIHGGPLIVLREDRGGPPRARVDRIMAYLKWWSARAARARQREKQAQDREAQRLVPCVYCGEQTHLWERTAGIGMCATHHRSMSGRFPFSRWSAGVPLDPAADDALFVARKALYVFEKLVRQEEAHVRQAR